MCVPGAIAATSAAIVEHDDRCPRSDDARHDRARRLEQSARRAQDEYDQRGVRRVGLVDDAGQILGGYRMNDSVQLTDDDRRPLGRHRRDPHARRGCDEQRQERSDPPGANHG
jgi:hypothetical protein